MPTAEPVADWAPAAERDVDDVWDYCAENVSEDVARRLLNDIFAAVARVAAHPMHGRARADLRSGLRSVRASPYLIFYRSKPGGIEVVRVLHERRDLEVALAESGS